MADNCQSGNPSVTFTIETSFGIYTTLVSPLGVRRICFPDQSNPEFFGSVSIFSFSENEKHKIESIMKSLSEQLTAYHNGKLKRFSVKLDFTGHTEFRRLVWNEMRDIPFGKTLTYGELADKVGCKSARAIGQACGANPVPLLVPCHRVIAANGKPGGWSGAPGFKERLLVLEKNICRKIKKY